MKTARNLAKTAAIVSAVVVSTGAMAAEWEDVEFYPFEEATFTYSVEGMQSGSQVQVIRDHGRETASFMDTQMSMMGMNQKMKTGSWTTRDWVYTYDYTTNTGTKIANPIKEMMANTDDPKEAYMQFMAGFGGQQVGTDTHNGTPCTVWEIAQAGTKACISDDLVMQYTRMNLMGMTQTIELVEQDIGPVADDQFVMPDVPYNEVQMPTGMPGM
ncbi:MAG: hypothetical protein ACE363_14085 [Alphaproteobacteria bacterium]